MDKKNRTSLGGMFANTTNSIAGGIVGDAKDIEYLTNFNLFEMPSFMEVVKWFQNLQDKLFREQPAKQEFKNKFTENVIDEISEKNNLSKEEKEEFKQDLTDYKNFRETGNKEDEKKAEAIIAKYEDKFDKKLTKEDMDKIAKESYKETKKEQSQGQDFLGMF